MAPANPVLFMVQRATGLRTFVLLMSSFVTSCATPEPAGVPHRTPPGTKKPSAAAPAAPTATDTAAVAKPPLPSGDDLAQFVVRAGTLAGPFTETDRQMVSQLPPKPQAGSIQEAAVAVAILRTAYNPATAQPAQFTESDLGNGLTANKAGDPATTKRSDLEIEATNRGFDFAAALELNQFLQTEVVFKLVWAALAGGTNGSSDAFAERVKGIMAQRVRSWAKFGDDHGLSLKDAPKTPTPQINEAPETMTPSPASDPQPLTSTPGDVLDAEGLLGEAQALADRGDYDAAILQVTRVAADSPQFALAQEKLKHYSNKAVHSLRTKAAQAYTSAAPVNDPKTRASYLERAKSYLQEALNKYPAADQLATVRDNLAVITRDLAKLTQDGPAGNQQDGSSPQ